MLALARHKSKREIEALIARLRPQPPVPDVIRKLPVRIQAASQAPLPVGAQGTPSPSRDDDTHASMPAVPPSTMPAPAMPPARRAVVSPLAPERYRVQFTASAELHAKLREAQALLRHQIPDGDLEQIFDRALEALLATLHKQKLAATDRPREKRRQASRAAPPSSPRSRHIPAAVRRTVWARDDGRCAFVSSTGQRCTEEGFLEFHHVVPYARGGPSTVENLELRCRAHNGYEAERHFGRWGTAATREDPAVYTSGASAVGVAAVPGGRCDRTRSGTSSVGNSGDRR
ncbi:MAG: HNH endonuclease [Armatimonadetes bacterium]|nr:HNH endonuclease [Armatimonadota bacterium]